MPLVRRFFSGGAAFDTNAFVKKVSSEGGLNEQTASTLANLLNTALQPKVQEISQSAVTRAAFEQVKVPIKKALFLLIGLGQSQCGTGKTKE